MTGYLLDTNVISERKRARPDEKLSAFIAGEPLARLYLGVVTFAEIRFGIELLVDAARRSDLYDWLDNKLRPMFDGRELPITEDILLKWRVIIEEGTTASITVCAFTTDETDAPLIRLLIEPNGHNGLHLASRLMVDKITTVPKSKLGTRIGRLDDQDIVRLNAHPHLPLNEYLPRLAPVIGNFDYPIPLIIEHMKAQLICQTNGVPMG